MDGGGLDRTIQIAEDDVHRPEVGASAIDGDLAFLLLRLAGTNSEEKHTTFDAAVQAIQTEMIEAAVAISSLNDLLTLILFLLFCDRSLG
jgi:hypothetical protein